MGTESDNAAEHRLIQADSSGWPGSMAITTHVVALHRDGHERADACQLCTIQLIDRTKPATCPMARTTFRSYSKPSIGSSFISTTFARLATDASGSLS